MLLWDVFNVLAVVGGDLYFSRENWHFRFLRLFSGLLAAFLGLLRLSRREGRTKVADRGAVLLAEICVIRFLGARIFAHGGELLLVHRVFGLCEGRRALLEFEASIRFACHSAGGAGFQRVHVHGDTATSFSGSLCFGGFLLRWRGGSLSLGLLVKASPAEGLLIFLVFFALQRFNFLSVLDHGRLLVKLNLGFLVGRLCEVLLLRLSLRNHLGVLFLVLAVLLFACLGGRTSSRRFGFLILLLLVSLLLKQVLNNLFLFAHVFVLEMINQESF